MQFVRYLGNLLQGDFGPSFQYKDFTVTELIVGGFPTSLTLGGAAIAARDIARHRARHAGGTPPERVRRLRA